MRAAKTRTLNRSTTPRELFEAAASVVVDGTYTVLERDDENLRIAFSSGKTAVSWGQEYLAEVVASGDVATLTVVCGSLDKAPKALMDGWKGGKAADKFLIAVESTMDAQPPA